VRLGRRIHRTGDGCCYGARCGQPKNRHDEVASEMRINHRQKQSKDGLR
jgi:hypothetical protein